MAVRMNCMGSHKVGRNDVVDFRIRHLFSRAEEAVARVADNDVHLSLKKGMIYKRVDVLYLGQIQAFRLERPGILFKKICDLATVTHGSDDPVAPCEKLSGHSFAEAAAHPGNKPRSLFHDFSPFTFLPNGAKPRPLWAFQGYTKKAGLSTISQNQEKFQYLSDFSR